MSEPQNVKDVKIGILGAAGRMGGALVRSVLDTRGATLSAALEREGHPSLGLDAGQLSGAGPCGVALAAKLPTRVETDVWIDFSSPAATVNHARAAAESGIALVVGTTGLDPAQKAELGALAQRIPIMFAPNMSVGVNVLLKLVADAARLLGPSYDLEIVETHHRGKRDAPSGTALALAQAVADASGRDLSKTARYERHGDVGPRTAEEIGVQTLRGGDVVGDHTVYFLGLGDRVEITHRASSRETFSRGAVRAALWLPSQKPGLYDMRDVLGLKQT